MAGFWTNAGKVALLDGSAPWVGGTFCAAIVSAAYTPAATHAAVADILGASGVLYDDGSGVQVQPLVNMAVALDAGNNRAILTADDLVFSYEIGATLNHKYLAIFVGTDTGGVLVAVLEQAATVEITGGDAQADYPVAFTDGIVLATDPV